MGLCCSIPIGYSSIDLVVPLHALRFRLIAEANAIEDTFYYLVKALDRDSIDFDHYLK
ncbi:hypothetical protein SARC_16330, partial [Sphaeroforma arctica JP610]